MKDFLMNRSSRIFVAGHHGLVGSAIVRRLKAQGYTNIIVRSHSELELTDQRAVASFFEAQRPDVVMLAAAKVGGILANNTFRADFIYQNLAIQTNVIYSAFQSGTSRLIFLGSNCIYPRDAIQPIKEEYLLSGPLEPTNEPYAIAKIAGVKLCESLNRQYGTRYVAAMPINQYGPGDNYDLSTSHVLPALIRKVHEAKQNHLDEVVLWGTGQPRREFMYSEDCADACIFLASQSDAKLDSFLKLPGGVLFNVGAGEDHSILSITEKICSVLGYSGRIVHDLTKPDGTPRKLLDSSRMTALGWQPSVSLEEGLQRTYQAFLASSAARS